MAPRANWKGFLRLSLVTCPVALYPATSDSEKVSFNQINRKTGHRIKYAKVDADTGEEVASDDIVKGYKVDTDTYIEVSKDELDDIALESTHTIEIDEFVPKTDIDSRYLIRPYYLVPDGKVGHDAFAVIRETIRSMNKVAIGRVVLTNCDAFDTFPPFPFNVVFRLLKGERRMKLNLLPMRLRVIRHSPLGFGLLARRLDAVQTRSWIKPALADRRIRQDAVRFLREMNPRELLDVSTRLKDYPGPVRIVWGAADYAFKRDLGRRLQQAFRSAELIELPEARTFVAIDAPEALAGQIASFAIQPPVVERELSRPLPA